MAWSSGGRRAPSPIGLGRNGATASPSSGDIVLAFATGRVEPRDTSNLVQCETLFPYATASLFTAVVEATEESVINALVAGRDMAGRNGSRVYGIPHDRLRDVLRRYGRIRQ
jgi:L-aminopeptidase/D-esterase-like protein